MNHRDRVIHVDEIAALFAVRDALAMRLEQFDALAGLGVVAEEIGIDDLLDRDVGLARGVRGLQLTPRGVDGRLRRRRDVGGCRLFSDRGRAGVVRGGATQGLASRPSAWSRPRRVEIASAVNRNATTIPSA